MKYYCLIILFVLGQHNLFAQRHKTDSLVNLLKRHPQEDTVRVKLLNNFAALFTIEKPDTALIYANSSLQLAEKLKFSKGIADSWYHTGRAYTSKNEYQKALSYLFKSLTIREKEGTKEELRSLYNEIGVTYEYIDDLSNSLKYYLKALKCAESENNRFGIGFELGNVANIYVANEQWTKAFEQYSKALLIAKEIKDNAGIAYTSYSISQLYLQQNKYNESLQYLDTCIKLNEARNSKLWIISCKTAKGEILRKLKKYNESIKILYEALALTHSYPDKQLYIDCLKVLAEVNIDIRNIENATLYANLAFQEAKRLDAIDDISKIHAIFSRIYEQKGEHALSLMHFKKAEVIKDSLYSLKRTKIIENLLTNYELDKKQQEIISQRAEIENKTLQSNIFLLGLVSFGLILFLLAFLIWQTVRKNRTLRKQNEAINEQKEAIDKHNQVLLELNNTKDTLFSIISHDLRGPIASLQATLYLLQLGVLSEAELEKVSRELSFKVNDTTNLLNNLLYWAKSQMDGIKLMPEKESLQKITNEIISLLSHQAETKNIQLEVKISETDLLYADIQTISLILRNLLSNAVKFTPKGGKISLYTTYSDSMIDIHVCDTGLGIAEDDMKKLFSPLTHYTTQGTSHEVGTGLGLLLCKDFAERNNGSISVQSKEGAGSIFTLSLPLYKLGNVVVNN